MMPGLVNSHSHVGLTPFQLGVHDQPLELWGLARLGGRDVDPYLDHLYAATQMIESGVATVEVMQGADVELAEKIIKAYLDAGMRVSYGASVRDQNYLAAGAQGGAEDFLLQLPTELAKRFKSFMSRACLSTEQNVSNLQRLCGKYADNQNERVRLSLAPSNVHRCSDELLVQLKELATKHKVGIHIHLQETESQKAYGLRVWGKTPLQHLNDLGFLGRDVTCAHCVWVTEEDIRTMSDTGARACHLASSNLRLRSGIAPINRLLQMGIRVSLGTDEAGINDDKDILQEMRLVLNLHRVPDAEGSFPTAYQVFQMATENGAYVTGFGDRIGTLAPGKRADLVLLNLRNIESPYLESNVSALEAVVQRGRSLDVEMVMIDGEVVFRDRQSTRVDKEAVCKEISKSLSRPLQAHELEAKEFSDQLAPYLRRFCAKTARREPRPYYHYNARS